MNLQTQVHEHMQNRKKMTKTETVTIMETTKGSPLSNKKQPTEASQQGGGKGQRFYYVSVFNLIVTFCGK